MSVTNRHQTERSGRPTPLRRDGVDFWRGVILCIIFVNHVPGTMFERFTPKNFGFSDSSECFVFISGLSLALAYGNRFSNGGRVQVMASLARRVVQLYGVHIGLSLAGVAIFAAGAAVVEPDLMQVHGRDLFIDDPGAALLGVMSLGHQLGYFNILPLYVLLVAMVPALLWLGGRSRILMLIASAMLYGASRLNGWNIPSWPMKGEWFFDPFTWQLLMAIGIAVGLGLRRAPFPTYPFAGLVAGLGLLVGAVCVTDGLSWLPGLGDDARRWFDLDKTVLGAGRLIHFLCVAYLVHALRLADRMRDAPWFRPFCLIGRGSLWAFAITSLLAAFGQVVTEGFGHSPLVDILLIAGGTMIVYRAAVALDARRAGLAPRLATAKPG